MWLCLGIGKMATVDEGGIMYLYIHLNGNEYVSNSPGYRVVFASDYLAIVWAY